MVWTRDARRVVLGVALLALVLGAVIHCRGRTAPSVITAPQRGDAGRPATANASRSSARMAPRGSIAGTVRDQMNAPIANAQVCARGAADDISPLLLAKPRCATSDAAGSYAIRQLWPASYEVVAGAPSYRPARYRAPAPREEGPLHLAEREARGGVDMVLDSGGVQLTGFVTDLGGGPIAGARVTASGDGLPVETDDHGAFTVWTNPGLTDATAEADGYQPGHTEGSAPGAVHIELEPGSTLAGTVVDDATGAPLADAYVMVDGGEEHDVTGADGMFRFERLAAGRYLLRATTSHGNGVSELVRVGLGASVDGLVIRLRPALSVAGRVLLPGAPVRECPDATLTLVGPPVGDDESGYPLEAIRFGGTLEVRDVPPANYQVFARCPGWLDAPAETLVVADRDIVDRTWTVTAGGTIEGRVTTRAGAPVPDVDIFIERAAVDTQAVARTDATGFYTLRGLPAGTYEVKLELDSMRLDSPRAEPVAVAVGTRGHRDFVIDDLGSVRVVVVDPSGRRQPNVILMLTRPADSHETHFTQSGTTNDGGEMLFARIPIGRVEIYRESATALVEAGRTAEIRIVQPARTATLRGIVLRPDGLPSTDALVSVSSPGGASALTGMDGTFVVDGLPDNETFTVGARDPAGRSAHQDNVMPGTVQLRLIEPSSIDGTIRNAPASTKLVLRVDIGHRLESQTLPPSGAFAFDDLDPGEYTVTAETKTGRLVAAVTLAGGDHKHLSLVFAPYQSVSVRVLDAVTKAPLPDITVDIGQLHGTFGETTNASGRVTFAQAEPGEAWFRAHGEDKQGVIVGFVTATLPAGTSEVTLHAIRANYAAWSKPGFYVDEIYRPDCNGSVMAIDPKGPGAAAGIEPMDRVSAINGQPTLGPRCILTRALLHPPPGTPIVLELNGSKKIMFKAVAAPPPE